MTGVQTCALPIFPRHCQVSPGEQSHLQLRIPCVCLCLQEGLLYWCDARTDRIERINLETGENRELVLVNNNMDMFAVSVFEGYIYWSDRSNI